MGALPATSYREEESRELAVMLTGGGARAAYQAGLLKGIATHFPHIRFKIITGVSAGAINAIYLAAGQGDLPQKAAELERMWSELNGSSIYRFDWKILLPFRSALASILARKSRWTSATPRALVDTTPLHDLLCQVFRAAPGRPIRGIEANIRAGELNAVALMTLDYSTGQSVRWVQGRNFDEYDGLNRRVEMTQFTVEHVLASSALPFVFPAVRIGNSWHGDGGIRLGAPLSAAVHLGAHRILAMSTGHQQSVDPEPPRVMTSYPPTAQILSQLVNAIFLDAVDEDVARMERMNELLRKTQPEERNGLKPIDLLVLRPSIDLGKLAGEYEEYLPARMKVVLRAIGVKETASPDIASVLMFEPHYSRRLIELGESDVEARLPEIAEFLGEECVGLATAGARG
ncbi:MAG TPA: patatin-like phospholipase family protein [Thermoanaerobaculia bacterium]